MTPKRLLPPLQCPGRLRRRSSTTIDAVRQQFQHNEDQGGAEAGEVQAVDEAELLQAHRRVVLLDFGSTRVGSGGLEPAALQRVYQAVLV
ncbi:hypothetical protein TKK_0005390 [Trichogramma kaykai]